ncbi:hypothetical protein OG21DRAFT_1102783 [Imleria badia]|nr:hypothetical protein OG21DRAFT_1102783 [Imleria badia]
MTTTTKMSARSPSIEIDVGSEISALTFIGNGEYLVSGGDGVRVWKVKNGEEMARMEARSVQRLAASEDGRWIAAGTLWGDLIVWDTTTYEQVFAHKEDSGIYGVDFSPDSTRLVATSRNCTAIWDVALQKQVQTLRHEDAVNAVKFSPHGDRFATTAPDSVRVWDSKDGRLLVEIQVRVTHESGPLWSNCYLFVISGHKIRQFDASTGSPVSEWPVPNSDTTSCISLSQHGHFITYSTNHIVSFWDTSTHAQLGLLQQPQDIHSIALSPNDQFLAIGRDEKIVFESLPHISNSTILSPLHPTFQEPVIQIDDATLDSWKHDQLESAEALLTAAIPESQNPSHHVLASRALVRARLQQWDTALVDAETAIEIQPSVIAFIAKSIALVGKGERDKGYRACDIAFEHFHSSHVTFLLLVKAIIVFMAGEHRDAISRVDDLIATVHLNSICYIVQAYMYLLLGNTQMERNDITAAIQSFEHGRAQIRHHTSLTLSVVSLISGWKFEDLGITIRQRQCEALYAVGRTRDAAECFHQMISELGEETYLHGEWIDDFRQRSSKKFEHLGDAAVNARGYDEAIFHYTTALSLNPPSPQGMLVKRSKAFLATGSWRQALDDANQVITLDPSSPWGYEMKHAALHKAGDYDNAVGVLEVMLSKLVQSPDPDVQRHCDYYIGPSSARATIHKIVERTIRRLPRVLINTTTGRLHNRAEQASAFESLPIFNELISSMTTRVDYVRIKREVREYFRYVMLSHKWEENEPLFQQVVHIAVYDLGQSPTHDKLQTFCKIVRDAGFNWAWCDTCCINKSDHFILQEALVAMFKWYQGSAMMIVFLRGVRSSSQRGALVKSIWNTRGWTLQEYVASKAIRFYTEDWTLYLDLQLPNHKESPEVISEMEQATGVSSQQLMALRPGLSSIREKLRLASTRQTTLVEDTAYSLLGIFSVTGLPAIYGAGEGALGRLLALVLTGSGDVSILAWTGESGSYNSCLPANITVFNGPATSHLPAPITDAELRRIITTSQSSSCDLNLALRLYDRLNQLSAPWFVENRMKLPCIAFQLPPFSLCRRTRSGRTQVYRAHTVAFGMVEIKSRHDLSQMKSLCFVHPWLDTLLEREDRSNIRVGEDIMSPPSPNSGDEEISDEEIDDDEEFFDVDDNQESFDLDDEEFFDVQEFFDVENNSSLLAQPELPSQPSPVHMDRERRARRLVARLRQPFGALLLTLASKGGRAVDYRRVAPDGAITVQFQENVSLADILDNVRTLDVL